ncbi:MAG: flagellar biosynthesis protein FlhA [Firmicutes bacterium]|nr:flagellar biosynthesis protein FlhA [Bacillota bacterium]
MAAQPWQRWFHHTDILVVAAVVLIIVMMVIPLPPILLDILLATNICAALLILLLTMNVTEPLEFSIFPSLLLLATLFRLALNVSSTRLILLHGHAGKVIDAFGQFVVGGNYVVGFVIFFILVIVQFVVITKGAERVAEVAARFTLDAMPGKQMSIDADLNAGLINDAEARQRRRDIEREADFYGAMDGASKFVKGDAIAGIIILLIDILGGIVIGVVQKNMTLQGALQHYCLLTVGDGLVSQIPALLISTATGIIITRAASEANLGQDLTGQLFRQPRVLASSAGVLLFFALVPGLPTLPFLLLAAGMGSLAYGIDRAQRIQEEKSYAAQRAAQVEEGKKPTSVLPLLQMDMMEIEIGYGLIPLVDVEQGGDLLERVTMIRRQCALELGIVIPAIRIRDNMQLSPNTYCIKIKGVEMGSGELMCRYYLAMKAGPVSEEIPGIATTEPAFGLPALWITEDKREQAEWAGYTVVDAPSVLATHLTEIIKSHAHELLGRQEVKTLLDALREQYSAVVEELVPDLLTLGEIQKVLQNLLREGVSIRNLVTILETLADNARHTRDPEVLTEQVRQSLARQISSQYAVDGVIPVITLEPRLEEELLERLEGEGATHLVLEPHRAQGLIEQLASLLEKAAAQGVQAVCLCSSRLRLPLRKLTERVLPRLTVLAYSEIAHEFEVQSFGMVNVSHEG